MFHKNIFKGEKPNALIQIRFFFSILGKKYFCFDTRIKTIYENQKSKNLLQLNECVIY